MEDKGKILIVDDNIELLKAMENTLSKDFKVVIGTNLSTAEDLLDSGVSLVISDIRLDENDPNNHDGLLLLEKLRNTYPQIPVVMMTAYGNIKLQDEVRKLGAFDYLPKPINLDELENVINRALSLKKRSITKELRGYLGTWYPPVLFFILVILFWEGITTILKVPNYLIPSPQEVSLEIYKNASLLLVNTGVTILESIFGFIIGSGFGFLIASGFAHSSKMEKSVYPYMIALKAIPLVAIAPLLILWFGDGIFGKMIMAALICFFPAIVNTTIGLKAVSRDALYLMHSLSATKWQIFAKLRLPTSMPYFFSALKISSTLAVVGAIVAELAGSDRGIGYLILISSYRMDTVTLFAAIIAASAAGVAFFGVISWLEKKSLYWHESLTTI